MTRENYKIKSYFKVLSLMSLFLMASPASAQDVSGCIAPTFPESTLDLSDGAISTGWPNIETYVNLTEFGDGGFIKFSHNTTHIFGLIGVNDEDWVAIEFESTGEDCMISGHDTWVFYMDYNTKTMEAIDSTMEGLDIPEPDIQNDLYTEATFADNFVYIEIVRAFDTLDTSSYDIPFMNGSELVMTVASKGDHFGDRTPYFLCVFFTSNPEPYVPNIDLGIDWTERKNILFYGGLIFAIFFITTHIVMRGVLYPLKHQVSIIDSKQMRSPTLKERWKWFREPIDISEEKIIQMEDADQ